MQELGELALRQHHARAEVAERQPEQLLHGLRDGPGAVGERLALLVGAAGAGRVTQPLQPGARTDTPPLAARRSSRAATYRAPPTSNTSRTVPRLTVGASASATVRLLSQRGTDPYSANVSASITVDLPAPVGPTNAK
ncbi:hypothetical protein BJF90_06990 [Pseudonocardia sp. CNS-004]|nr:hypothetical protein BJF90_06990 [Pseudonocardia sp. CNS-004]